LKDFDFSTWSKNHQECTLATCYSFDLGDSRSHCGDTHDEKNIIEIIEKSTIVDISLLIQNGTNIKTICEMLKRGDSRLGGILDDRPLIKQIVEHARNEFLTDILTREIKDEN